MTVHDLATVGILLAMAVLFGRLVGERVPGTWPRVLRVLLPVAAVGAVVGVVTDASTYLWRWAGLDVTVPVVVVVLGLVILVVGRRAGLSWPTALWLGGSIVLIGMTTLPSELGSPHLLADAGARLNECVTKPSRWLPTGEYRDGGTTVLVVQVVSNIALFVPLGAGVALVRSRPWWLAVVPPLLVSVGIETFQAMFTARVCAPIDVMTNALGGAAGFSLCLLSLAVERRRHPAESEC